mmetsp:Transcript_2403/g.6327  ORF Transcript_2403/g.6327 Transcript_2403/m.6327 type:complete len:335 (-) Transcript_2403:172-1176(-)
MKSLYATLVNARKSPVQCHRVFSVVVGGSLGERLRPKWRSNVLEKTAPSQYIEYSTTGYDKSSVSNEEVSKFSDMASTWWDSAKNPLIGMNPVRVSFIVDTLRSQGRLREFSEDLSGAGVVHSPLEGLRALDVGCGGGLLSESLARLGADVTAIDPSEDVAAAAREHSRHDFRTRGINYRGGVSVESLALEVTDEDNEHRFDVVCMLEVIEHATDQRSLLEGASWLLKRPTPDGGQGGMLFLSTVNRTAKSYAVTIVGAEHILRMLPVGTHTWEKYVSPNEADIMVSELGLATVDVSGMVVKPPFLDMRWKLDRDDTDINWIGAYSFERSSSKS